MEQRKYIYDFKQVNMSLTELKQKLNSVLILNSKMHNSALFTVLQSKCFIITALGQQIDLQDSFYRVIVIATILHY